MDAMLLLAWTSGAIMGGIGFSAYTAFILEANNRAAFIKGRLTERSLYQREVQARMQKIGREKGMHDTRTR